MAAATFISLLMPTVEAFAVVMPTFVAPTVVMSAFVTAFVVMSARMAAAVVITPGVRIIPQCPFGQRLRCRVRGTGHPAVKLNPGFCQCVLRTHADAAADERVHLRGLQKAGQCAVPAAVGRDDLL